MQLPAFSGHKKTINLLPKDSFESSSWGVVLSWALAFGKWTVILTQLVVMGVFMYRFVLDRQVTNLRREIEQQKAVVESYAQIESDFTLVQSRLNFAKPVLERQKSLTNYLGLLQSVTPSDVWYERLSLDGQSIHLTANASSLVGFSSLLAMLQQRPEFDSISVGKLENGSEANAQVAFEISAHIKQTKAKDGK